MQRSSANLLFLFTEAEIFFSRYNMGGGGGRGRLLSRSETTSLRLEPAIIVLFEIQQFRTTVEKKLFIVIN